MRVAARSLSPACLLLVAAACGGGGKLTPSVIRSFAAPEGGQATMGESACVGAFRGGMQEQIISTSCGGPNGEACTGNWSFRVVEPGGPEDVPAPEIGGSAALRRVLPAMDTSPRMTAFDADEDGIDDLVVACPPMGAVFVLLDPLSPTATVVGPFLIPDGPIATPRYNTMVLSTGRRPSIDEGNEFVVVGMPDAGGGRGQIAVLASAPTRAGFGPGQMSAPMAPATVAPGDRFGAAVAGRQQADGSYDLYVGTPGRGGGAVDRIHVECHWEGSRLVCTITFGRDASVLRLGPGAGLGTAICLFFDPTGEYRVGVGAPDAFDGDGAIVTFDAALGDEQVIGSPTPGRGFGAELDVIDIDGDGNEEILAAQPNSEPEGWGAVAPRINWDIRPANLRMGLVQTASTRLSEDTLETIGGPLAATKKWPGRVRYRTDFVAYAARKGPPGGLRPLPNTTLRVRDLTDKSAIEYVAPKMTP